MYKPSVGEFPKELPIRVPRGEFSPNNSDMDMASRAGRQYFCMNTQDNMLNFTQFSHLIKHNVTVTIELLLLSSHRRNNCIDDQTNYHSNYFD